MGSQILLICRCCTISTAGEELEDLDRDLSEMWKHYCMQVRAIFYFTPRPRCGHHYFQGLRANFRIVRESRSMNHTKLPTLWGVHNGRKHHKKDQNTANRMANVFCYAVGTAVWPLEFYHRNLLLNQRCKIPLAIPRFLIGKKQTPSFHLPWFGLPYGVFAIVYCSLVILLLLIHRDSRNLRELTRRRPWLFHASAEDASSTTAHRDSYENIPCIGFPTVGVQQNFLRSWREELNISSETWLWRNSFARPDQHSYALVLKPFHEKITILTGSSSREELNRWETFVPKSATSNTQDGTPHTTPPSDEVPRWFSRHRGERVQTIFSTTRSESIKQTPLDVSTEDVDEMFPTTPCSRGVRPPRFEQNRMWNSSHGGVLS